MADTKPKDQAGTPSAEAPGEPTAGAEPAPETPRAPTDLEQALAAYPLREPQEDPRWAVGIVWTWLGIGLLSTAFVLALMVLGYFYD